jgi:hypothetical protein
LEYWKHLKIGDRFRIRVPLASSARIEEDEATVAIRIGEGEDASELLIANFPLRKSSGEPAELMSTLRGIIEQFFHGPVSEAGGHILDYTVEAAEDPENAAWTAAGIARALDDCACVAKACARLREDHCWLLHWNGPATDVESILKILSSFKIGV